jgi:regulator of replication initiation timing
VITAKKPWLLQSQAEKNQQEVPEDRSLLAASLYASMQNNEELRLEVDRLRKNIEDAQYLMEQLNSKIAILSTLNKHGTSKNPTPNNI